MTAPVAIVVLFSVAPVLAQAPSTQPLREYSTDCYILKTDVPNDQAREASLRMTMMAREYAARTRDFMGAVNRRLPFYLVHDDATYLRLGGIKGSAGLFDGQALVVHVPDQVDARVWHTLQHEGFHQFAYAAIGGQRPAWVNEGLAEYFGEAIFTGDGFVTGVIPQWRLQRIRKTLAEGKFRPLNEMMHLSLDEWNSKLSVTNYDQGWSMVQFLVDGDGRKYRSAFAAFMAALGRNIPWETAWKDQFGSGDGFEQRWRSYWQNLPDHPTAALYRRGTVATLTSFLARASSQRQTFATFPGFEQAARSGRLQVNAQWLPATLLADALSDANELARDGAVFKIVDSRTKKPLLVCELADGSRLTGRFVLRDGAVISVDVDEILPTNRSSAR
jgi:hypothetical protein